MIAQAFDAICEIVAVGGYHAAFTGGDNLTRMERKATDVADAPNPPAGFVPGPKHIVIKLPVKVNINDLQINPANTCGDPGSASTGDYLVETSPDGTNWTTANSGNHFGIADRNMHSITMAPGSTSGVQYIRYTMLGTQVIDLGGDCAVTPDAFAGCTFMDSTELGVYGAAA